MGTYLGDLLIADCVSCKSWMDSASCELHCFSSIGFVLFCFIDITCVIPFQRHKNQQQVVVVLVMNDLSVGGVRRFGHYVLDSNFIDR